MSGLSGLSGLSGIMQTAEFLLRDLFSATASAPLTTPRTAAPGPGTLTLIQTDGQLSTSLGRLNMPVQASEAWGDQGGYAGAVTRAPGVGISVTIRIGIPGECIPLSFSNAAGIYAGTASRLREAYYFYGFGTNPAALEYLQNGAYPGIGLASLAFATDYQLAIVLLAAGALYYIRGGAYTTWTELLNTTTDTTATLYPSISNKGSANGIDQFIAAQLPGTWTDSTTAAEKASILDTYFGPLPSQIHITSAADATALRTLMIAEIWSGGAYPSTGATSVSTSVSDPLTSSPTNLLRVDQLTINVGGGFSPTPYVWRPTVITSNNKLLIYHNGHSTNFEDAEQGDFIRAAVQAGYTVIGYQMIGSGNPTTHNTYTRTAILNYLRYFLEPVVRGINELVGEGYSAIYMAGLSGGGWTTVLMAAMDTRITRSVPAAGSLPLYLTSNRDWEQFLPGLGTFLGYQDLYIMATSGGRRQMALHNTTDACCFMRSQYDAAPYEANVVAAATNIGGQWSIQWDSTHSEHKISAYGRSLILAFLAAA